MKSTRSALLVATMLWTVPATALAASWTNIWSTGDRSVRARIPDEQDGDLVHPLIEVRQGAKLVRRRGAFARARLAWVRPPGVRGPDVVVEGNWGGSSGCLDVYAVSFGSRPRLEPLTLCHQEPIVLNVSRGVAELPGSFSIEGFNEAPDSLTTRTLLPLRWSGRRFEVDRFALARRRFDADELAFRSTAAAVELEGWRNTCDGGYGAFTAITTDALLGLMLSGHVDEAHAILDQAWPTDTREVYLGQAFRLTGTARMFCEDFCKAIVSQPLWSRLRLDRTPGAERIEAAAQASGASALGRNYFTPLAPTKGR